ncbi:MAG: APC family permease [Thermoplasmata archaeon]
MQENGNLANTKNDLIKGAVGLWRVTAQGLMSNAPMATFSILFSSAAVYALGASPIAFVFGALVVWFWVNTPYQFSKKLFSAAGMQYFVHKAMGSRAGFLAGSSYFTYYTALISSNILAYSVAIQYVLSNFGVIIPYWTYVPLSILILIPGFIINYLGIKTSLNYGIITVLIELSVITIMSILIIVVVGPANTLSVYNPNLGSRGIIGFAIGMLMASYLMSGTTSTVYLGYESKAPQRIIKRSLFLATLLVVFVFVLLSYALTVGWGLANISALASAPAPGIQITAKYFGRIPEMIIFLLALNSFFGVSVASIIIVSRLTLTFSRQGLFPKSLGKIHSKYKVPHIAITFVFILGIIWAQVVALILGAFNAYIWLILEATIAEFIGHIIGDVALPAYYLKKSEFSVLKHVVLPVGSLIIILFGIFYTFYPISPPIIYAPIFMIVVLILSATLHWAKARKNGISKMNEGIDSLAIESGILERE